MRRMERKFHEFEQARKYVRELLTEYVNDYKNFQGSDDDRREFLEDIYGSRAAQISHLLFENADRKIYWHVQDIAIILGRDTSTITRTLASMERENVWCSKLLALRKDAKSANNNKIYVYHEEIFELILDHYEQEYLLRFSNPRHGEKSSAPDMSEIMRFWNYLKNSENAAKLKFESESAELDERDEFPEVPLMSWGDVFALMWRKILTVKTGILFSIMFAFTFEIARKFSWLVPYFFVISIFALGICAIFLRRRISRLDIISDSGALALLFVFSWGAGLISGTIYTPSGAVFALKHDLKISLKPELSRDKRLNFAIIPEDYNRVAKVMYRISPELEFVSSGFNDFGYPVLFIEPEQQSGVIKIDVKITDTDSIEHEIFTFEFDIERERADLSSKIRNQKTTL